MVKTYAERG